MVFVSTVLPFESRKKVLQLADDFSMVIANDHFFSP